MGVGGGGWGGGGGYWNGEIVVGVGRLSQRPP